MESRSPRQASTTRCCGASFPFPGTTKRGSSSWRRSRCSRGVRATIQIRPQRRSLLRPFLKHVGGIAPIFTASRARGPARMNRCVKSERPCRFLGRGSFRSGQPCEIPFVPCGHRLRVVSKTSRRTKPGNTRLSPTEARARGDGPQFRRSGLDSRTAPASAPRPNSNHHRPQARALSLSTCGTPDVSSARLRSPMSISRSTLASLIDERRCRRNRSPRCPRVERGAPARSRARSARSPICSTIRASSK